MNWVSITAEVGADDAESFSDALLGEGAISVDIHDPRAGTEGEQAIFNEPGEPGGRIWEIARITALFEQGVDHAKVVESSASSAGLGHVPGYVLGEVREQDWVRLTQSQFSPIRISERLWITPTWHDFPEPDAINLVLDPGLAFGTGSHPTTRLCLEWLDGHMEGGETVLDYGCGSGILAIAALKLGASLAVGTDIDPQAIIASRQNALQNGVECMFFLPEEAPVGKYDIVIANILTNPLKLLAPILAECSKKRIVLSGILERQALEIVGIYSEWFEMEEPVTSEGWACIVGKRRG
ncbi:MAG TPA: 50S ribosomal protein L11 methyltransferase [Burkholderiales bacterium]|nr:50S ribosomal protein L11 methyltransferase [Burkholderiales bacterium]